MAGSDGLKVGDIAKITGLSSLSGQELNGQEGTVTRFVELKSRFEIMLSSTRLVSLKPENLWRVGGAVDGRWSRGDLARVVGVPTQQEAQAVSGSLGELVSRGQQPRVGGASPGEDLQREHVESEGLHEGGRRSAWAVGPPASLPVAIGFSHFLARW